MLTKIATLAITSLVLGLLALGCGSSDSGGGSIDKATFVQQAESICKEVSGRLAAEANALGAKEAGRPGSSPDKTLLKLVTQIALPGFEEEFEKIRALGVPSEAKPQVEAFLGAMRKMISEAETNPKTFVAPRSLPYEAAQLAGRRFGLAACPIRPPGTS